MSIPENNRGAFEGIADDSYVDFLAIPFGVMVQGMDARVGSRGHEIHVVPRDGNVGCPNNLNPVGSCSRLTNGHRKYFVVFYADVITVLGIDHVAPSIGKQPGTGRDIARDLHIH